MAEPPPRSLDAPLPEPSSGASPPPPSRRRISGEWSLRGHLFGLMIVCVLPLGILLVQGFVVDSRNVVALAEEGAGALAETTAHAVSRFFMEAESTLAEIARRDAVRTLDPEPCTALLRDLLGVLPRYANLFVADASGDVLCSALPSPAGGTEPVLDRSWFGGALTGDRFVIGDPQIGRISGRWVTVLAYPVPGPDGLPAAVLGAAVDLVSFEEVLVRAPQPGGTLLTIDNLEGVVVARSADAEAWVGRPLPASGLAQDVLRRPRGVTRTPSAGGEERIWGFSAIPESTWRAWAGVPSDEVLAPVREGLVRKAGILLVSLLLVVGVAALLYRRIEGALGRLVEETAAVGAGIGSSLTPTGPIEVRQVAEAFNRTLQAREAAEEARRRNLERYRSVMEHAVFGIAVVGSDDRIREANPALADLVGASSASDLLGRSFAELFLNPSEARELRERLASGDAVAGIQATWRSAPQGGVEPRELVVRLHGTACHDVDGSRACEWIIEDMTERLVLEARVREVQKLEAVGRLSGGVAHDFNNLLTVITTTAHLLREEWEGNDPQTVEGLDEILDAAARGASLTRQLLTFSRKQVVRPELLELNRSVDAMAGLLQRLVGNGIDLTVELEPGAGWVEVDPAQLQQVLLNLAVNARDASQPGDPVRIRTGVVEVGVPPDRRLPAGLAPGSYSTLEVTDRGVGVTPEIRDRIFEPFFSTKPEGRGTGLGLATVYGIATQAGGGVAVRSRNGAGSIFTVYLPRREEPARTAEPKA